MIDAALAWFMRFTARSQMREADRLEAEAEALKQRAAKLRWQAGLYLDVGQTTRNQ